MERLLEKILESPNSIWWHGGNEQYIRSDSNEFYITTNINYAFNNAMIKGHNFSKNMFLMKCKLKTPIDLFDIRFELDETYYKINLPEDYQKYLPHIKTNDWLEVMGEKSRQFVINQLKSDYDGFINFESSWHKIRSACIFDMNNIILLESKTYDDWKESKLFQDSMKPTKDEIFKEAKHWSSENPNLDFDEYEKFIRFNYHFDISLSPRFQNILKKEFYRYHNTDDGRKLSEYVISGDRPSFFIMKRMYNNDFLKYGRFALLNEDHNPFKRFIQEDKFDTNCDKYIQEWNRQQSQRLI